ncbi:MAG TPA: hypothetical protein VNM68_02410 [Candidatus Polarisedimenticolia bacterium]|nr:hypothetical protein [Candidatus Polarisedimenticolia bacterium]
MVYKVTRGKSFVFQAVTPDGTYVQLGTGAKQRLVAKDIAHHYCPTERLGRRRNR